MTLYFISGLGVDRRTFHKLSFPQHIAVRHLEWIEPLNGESLPRYALRLAAGIDTSEEFSLVGLSFGGMIATEIAKVLSPRQVILLSSVATARELPNLYTLPGKLRMHKVLPYALVKQPNPFMFWLMDVHTPEEKQLFKDILRNTSPAFVRWAVDAIIRWRNEERPANLYHVHGSNDKVLPFGGVRADQVIGGAGHLMVFSHADLISRIIEERTSGRQSF